MLSLREWIMTGTNKGLQDNLPVERKMTDEMKGEHPAGCLVCGKDLVYNPKGQRAACMYCGREEDAYAICPDGHYICDRCHALPAEELIREFCIATSLKDPVAIALTLMKNPKVKMHGPEHHFLVPAVLLAAYYNVRNQPDEKEQKIRMAQQRAGSVIGGSCGLLGDCGAAVGVGIFISIITGATPLSRGEWQLANLATARSLEVIALHGGPRCCKRNSFLAIISAADYLRDQIGMDLPVTREIRCPFSARNRECLQNECPYFQC
jgi:hypothetical protein